MAATFGQALADAEAGNAAAQYALSQYYFARRDEAAALVWLKKAAQLKLAEAMFTLAQWLLSDLRNESTLVQVHELMAAASAAGLATADVLAAKTELLLAGPLNERQVAALSRLQSAANKGSAAAMRQLAFWPDSATDSHHWLKQAASRGDMIAQELLQAGIPTTTFSESAPIYLTETEHRIADFGNSASPLECAYIIAFARSMLRPSHVLDPVTGQRRPHPIRRSAGAVLDLFTMDAFCLFFMRRLCERLQIDWRRCEPVNVLCYKIGDEYRLHHDAFEQDPLAKSNAVPSLNQRSHTALLYLNNVSSGGETDFPRLEKKIQPETGKMYCFSNVRNGKPDPAMVHMGCPVLDGEKWLMTLWFRERSLIQLDSEQLLD